MLSDFVSERQHSCPLHVNLNSNVCLMKRSGNNPRRYCSGPRTARLHTLHRAMTR
jgi:hypothetical protein